MREFSILICFIFWTILVASSPSKIPEAVTSTTPTSQPALNTNASNNKPPVIHELIAPSLNHHNPPEIPDPQHLTSRAKSQKGNTKPNDSKQSKADKMIMNQKMQASNRDVILGWTLGVYGFLGFLALLAWYFDVLPGFGRSVEAILEGQGRYEGKNWEGAGFGEGDVEMENVVVGRGRSGDREVE